MYLATEVYLILLLPEGNISFKSFNIKATVKSKTLYFERSFIGRGNSVITKGSLRDAYSRCVIWHELSRRFSRQLFSIEKRSVQISGFF